MGSKIIAIYLRVLPFFLLSLIIFGTIRSAFKDNLAQNLLIINSLMDVVVIITNRKKTANKTIFFIIVLLTLSFVVGVLNNNELSRRYITDFTNPLFFFAKIFIFSSYFDEIKFESYIKYFSMITFIGSLVLLPITYFMYNYAGATRMAIFPPMELPFSYFMSHSIVIAMISVLIILLYGKRAQLIGAILTFLIFIFFFQRKTFIKYLIILVVGFIVLNYVFSEFKDNLAIRRYIYTFERLTESDVPVKEVGSSRYVEVESIMKEMDSVFDYIVGKGLGYQYNFEFKDMDRMKANAHFTPVSLLSKYGIIFTLFLYLFLFKFFKPRNIKRKDTGYITAWGVALFILFESFFSYAIFVTAIYPVALGYLLSRQNKYDN